MHFVDFVYNRINTGWGEDIFDVEKEFKKNVKLPKYIVCSYWEKI